MVNEGTKHEEEDTKEDQEEYTKLSKLFIQLEDNMDIRNASYGKSRSDYVRGKKFEEAVKARLDYVCETINKICKTDLDPKNIYVVQLIFDVFHDRSMLMKAQRFKEDGKVKFPKRLKPLEETEADACCSKPHKNQGHKHNSKEEEEDFDILDPKGFYIIDVEDTSAQKRTYFWLIMAIVIVLLACLFPVWPLELKLGIWWVSYILLVVMVGLIIIRLIFYMFFYIFGVDLWLFPNMFDDKVNSASLILAQRY